jgi:hypothetical protein
MKRKNLKLSLHRETLRHLQGAELDEAAGGLTTICSRATQCSCESYCPNCEPTSWVYPGCDNYTQGGCTQYVC